MSRADPTKPSRPWLTWLPTGGVGRALLVCAGLGLGTAFAADAVQLSIPEALLTEPAASDSLGSSQWRVFDPGFIVDHLPFKLTIGQSISYTDNVQNTTGTLIATNGVLTQLPARGDFYSDTTIGLAAQFPVSAQTFFFNLSYAPRRYFSDTALNADNYAINGGVDYNIANRCSGRLEVGRDSSQQTLAQTVGLGVQTSTATSFNQTARCPITGHIVALFNSGVSQNNNTGNAATTGGLLPYALNDYEQYYVSTGLEYGLSGLDTLRGIATFTTRDFTDRGTGVLGLAQETQQNDFAFVYDRILGPKLDISASGGISVFTTSDTGRETVQPNYSISVNYKLTPKVSASFTESKATGAPQTVIADAQTTDAQSLALSYRYSAKLSFSGVLSQSSSRSAGLGGPTSVDANTLLYLNSNDKAASVVASYTVSPLVTATASYTYSERNDTSRSGFDAVSNVFRVGLFYTR